MSRSELSLSDEELEFTPKIKRSPGLPISRRSGARLKNKAPMFNPNARTSPTRFEENRFPWWADEAADSLKENIGLAVEYSDDLEEVSNDNRVSKDTICISRQLAKQVSDRAYDDIVGSFRSYLTSIENACQRLILEEKSPKLDEESTGIPASNAKLDDVITRKVPQEISRMIAYKIFVQLTGDLDDDGDQISVVSYVTDEYETKFPRNVSDVRLNTWENGGGIPKVRSSDSIASTSVDPPPYGTPTRLRDAGAQNNHRRFYNENSDVLQLDAYKKFCLVLVNGRGFRVVKHNHGGGRKSRILKYNKVKNRVLWGSNKVLGAEYLDCNTIIRVKREEVVVYVWHTTGKDKKKKMVGFETQREYDARVLELALLYLQNQNNN